MIVFLCLRSPLYLIFFKYKLVRTIWKSSVGSAVVALCFSGSPCLHALGQDATSGPGVQVPGVGGSVTELAVGNQE